MGMFCCGTATAGDIAIKRVNNRSPVFYVAEKDVDYFMTYTGFRDGERFLETGIGPKAMDMIHAADQSLIMSVFLFDNFYADTEGQRDLVTPIVDGFLERLAAHDDMRIAVILDASHKAYGRRVSPAERTFRERGIDVFYSDVLSGLKKASLIGVREGTGHVNRLIDVATFGGWSKLGSAVFSRARVPVEFDGEPLSLESAYNAFLLKANHRKLLVTDVHGADHEVLITSANPHSASGYHINSAVSVRGAPARYVYNLLREDMMHSAGLGSLYAHWHDNASRKYRRSYFEDRFPELPLDAGKSTARTDKRNVGITIVTEEEIPRSVIELLGAVQPSDEVRIQMFYLSFQPVLDAILRASTVVDRPVRILLDANKDSFNKEKDGTPNRQVARYLLRKARARKGRIEIRWYSTHGEQNHAKTMSITAPAADKHVLTTGSCNWTGRNMDGVNMESNVVVDGSPKVAAAFNNLFDMFWTNADGVEYSLDYEAFKDAAPDARWRRGEKPYYWNTF